MAEKKDNQTEHFQKTCLVPVLGLKNRPPSFKQSPAQDNPGFEPETHVIKRSVVAEVHESPRFKKVVKELEIIEKYSVGSQCPELLSKSTEKFEIHQDDGDGCACFGKREKPHQTIPSYGLLVLLAFLLALGYVAYAIDQRTVTGLTDRQAGFERFSEERAWRDLRDIVGNGPRVASTPYHLEKTQDLYNLVNQISNTSNLVVHTDWQMADGDYLLTLTGGGFFNSYQNVSNVIALLEGESGFNADGTTNSTILLNCHYDSVPTSPGASDNAIFCAVMTEILRILAQKSEKPKHNILFLFNGAEENPMQGSHAFLNHRWSKGITALVNLDANGMNGRPYLFQCSDKRVLDTYVNAVDVPTAQSTGELLFNSGIIPSDTDFRIFRDFGQIYGIDIAFTRYSAVYHTVYDSLHLVSAGTVQLAGDMVLSIASELMDIEDFANKTEEVKTSVYYDYLNSFMLSYSVTAATVVDLLIAVLAILDVLYTIWCLGFTQKRLREFGWCLAGQIASAFVGAAFMIILILIASATMMQLRYLSHQWLVPFMFWIPYIFAAVFTTQGFHAWRVHKCGLNRSTYSCLWGASCRALFVPIVLISLAWPSFGQGRYIMTVPLLYSCVVNFITTSMVKYLRINALTHLLLKVAISIPIMLWLYTIAISFNASVIPNMARSTTAYPDLIIAMVNIGIIMVTILPLSGVELLFSRAWLWLVGTVVFIMCIIFVFLPVFPYSGNYNNPSPQRYYFFHTDYRSYDINQAQISNYSGIWATHIDVNTPVTLVDAVRESRLNATNIRTLTDEDCSTKLFCGIPTRLPKYFTYSPKSVWLDVGPPTRPVPDVQLIVNEKSCQVNVCSLNLTFDGHIAGSISISPHAGIELATWSLLTPPEQTGLTFNERPVYYIWRTRSTHSDDRAQFDILMSFNVPSSYNAQTQPLVTIAHTTLKLDHANEFTAEYNDIISVMPEYFQIAPYIAFRSDYEV